MIDTQANVKMTAAKFQLQQATGGKIDARSFAIYGVSVISEGEALGHGVSIDSQSLETVMACAETYAGGLKVKINHGSGAESIIGVLRNFKIDATQLRADLFLLRTHPFTPTLLEMAETMADSFGLSISFSGTVETTSEGEQGAVRCLEIYSCDIVDEPAANPTGLFSKIDTATTNKSMPTYETPEFLELKAQNEASNARFQKLDADFQAITIERNELSAKLETSEKSLAEFTAKANELSAQLEKQAEEHKAALSDFDAKIGDAAAKLLASTGAAPVKLGAEISATDAEIYEQFQKASHVDATTMLNDPHTGPRIRAESARRFGKK